MTSRVILALVCLTASFLLLNCGGQSNVEKDDRGVTIHLSGERAETHMIRIEMLTDKIAHVVAVPSDSFPGAPSLMTVEPPTGKVDWTMTETRDAVEITTSSLKVTVDKETGEVLFATPSGQEILREKTGGGKHLKPPR
ncbi:MAG: DUF4968 domain-containing protein [Bacteroidia bacterium]|nr:DUF4968 domain-containing protein [Bacteroidia bacterium]